MTAKPRGRVNIEGSDFLSMVETVVGFTTEGGRRSEYEPWDMVFWLVGYLNLDTDRTLDKIQDSNARASEARRRIQQWLEFAR